ncbi:MAG: hypothetical protein HC770_08620 [Pseudanabaena sp. CRU_2_10]|nr:hypothetical protein [Pseudanabaena sp. CRU_2_10]
MFVDKYTAAKITGLSAETLKKPRLSGNLKEGIHFVKLNSRIIRYNDELLQDWMQNRHDERAHQRAIEIYQASLLSNRKKKR